MIKIEPLTKKTLKPALKLLDKVFGYDSESKMQYTRGFHTSLGETKYLHLYPKGKPSYLNYFVAVDTEIHKVTGTVGLYSYPEEEKQGATWLGWYCVDPEQRGKGIGKMLLEYCIDLAKKRKMKFLRLWTSTNPNEKIAQQMYERRGFKIFKIEKSKNIYDIVHMELKLK